MCQWLMPRHQPQVLSHSDAASWQTNPRLSGEGQCSCQYKWVMCTCMSPQSLAQSYHWHSVISSCNQGPTMHAVMTQVDWRWQLLTGSTAIRLLTEEQVSTWGYRWSERMSVESQTTLQAGSFAQSIMIGMIPSVSLMFFRLLGSNLCL